MRTLVSLWLEMNLIIFVKDTSILFPAHTTHRLAWNWIGLPIYGLWDKLRPLIITVSALGLSLPTHDLCLILYENVK